MCTQPKGLLLTPDTWRMCLLRSLIFLCCFAFFILAAKENVRANFSRFLIKPGLCGSGRRCGYDVLALSAYVRVGAPAADPGAPHWEGWAGVAASGWGERCFTWGSGGKNASNGFLHGRVTEKRRQNKHVCLQKDLLLKCKVLLLFFFFFPSGISHQFHHHDRAFYKFSVIQTFYFDLMLLVYNFVFCITHIIKTSRDD